MEQGEGMERSQIMGKFEPLRRRFKNWKAPILTSAEQASEQKRQETVSNVTSTYTVEAFLAEGSKKRLDLNDQVASIVQRLQGETGTLENTQLAVNVLQNQLEEVRNVRLAADAMELVKQEHIQRMATMEEEARVAYEADEKEHATWRQKWAEEDTTLAGARALQRRRIQEHRERTEANYNYVLNRRRAQAEDERKAERAKTERLLLDEDERLRPLFADREAALTKLEAAAEKDREAIAQLTERLQTEPASARESAIKRVSNEAKSEAEALASEHEMALVTKDREIETLNKHLARQAEDVKHLEERIEKATEHNQRLALQAMNAKKGEA
jgi:hypothetical protein